MPFSRFFSAAVDRSLGFGDFFNSLSSLQLPLHGEGSAPINSQQNVISAHILVYGVAVPRHRH